MSTQAAPVLVHGATGFTGRLVCEALARRGLRFAIAGRDREKLARLSDALGGVETCVIDLAEPDTILSAIAERRVVTACAGPFAEIGEPILASCARRGVHYVDTTGEQSFVADAVARYHATAEASGACVVPAMAYEIAPADWGAHFVASRLARDAREGEDRGEVDEIAITYVPQNDPDAPHAATRGTRRSAVLVLANQSPRQFIDGALVHERAAAVLRQVTSLSGARVTAASFPSPEAIMVPSHVRARTVRTFMAMNPLVARSMNLSRAIAPSMIRASRGLVDRLIARGPEGPNAAARASARFEIICEATRGDETARVTLTGRDPYGLTAEIQAYAAFRAVNGGLCASGVVAPSTAFPPSDALAALTEFGLEVRS